MEQWLHSGLKLKTENRGNISIVEGGSGRDSVVRVHAVACALQRPTRACDIRFIAEINNLLKNIVIICSGRDSIVRMNVVA